MISYDPISAVRDFCQKYRLGRKIRRKTSRLKAGTLITDGVFICRKSAQADLYQMLARVYGDGYSAGYSDYAELIDAELSANIYWAIRSFIYYRRRGKAARVASRKQRSGGADSSNNTHLNNSTPASGVNDRCAGDNCCRQS